MNQRTNALCTLLTSVLALAALPACGDDTADAATTGTTAQGGAAQGGAGQGGSQGGAGQGGMAQGGAAQGGAAQGGGGSTSSGGNAGACGEITQTPDDAFTIAFGGDAQPFPFDPNDGGNTNCILTGAGLNAEFFDVAIGFFTVNIGTLSLGQNYLEPGVTVTAAEGASITVDYQGSDFDFRSSDAGGFAFASGDGTTDDPYVGCLFDVTTLNGFGDSGGLTATMPAAVPIVCRRPGQ